MALRSCAARLGELIVNLPANTNIKSLCAAVLLTASVTLHHWHICAPGTPPSNTSFIPIGTTCMQRTVVTNSAPHHSVHAHMVQAVQCLLQPEQDLHGTVNGMPNRTRQCYHPYDLAQQTLQAVTGERRWQGTYRQPCPVLARCQH